MWSSNTWTLDKIDLPVLPETLKHFEVVSPAVQCVVLLKEIVKKYPNIESLGLPDNLNLTEIEFYYPILKELKNLRTLSLNHCETKHATPTLNYKMLKLLEEFPNILSLEYPASLAKDKYAARLI